jgi:NADH-quinone oxidoreductase subunit J
MFPGTFVFIVLALVVVGTAVGMVISRNAIYSALFLVLNFATVAFLYFILGAPFIALVQVTVYAGSIMVLFLFVIMLLGAERLPVEEPLRGQRWGALALGLVFLFEIVLFVLYRSQISGMVHAPPVGSGDPAAIGMLLFNQYALPFEVTGFLLLVATVGAILLTRGEITASTFQLFGKKKE